MSLTKSSLKGARRGALVVLTIGTASMLVCSIVSAGPQAVTTVDVMTTVPVKWSSIGPRNVGGNSGKVNAFAYLTSNPSIMYIGGGWGNTPKESPSQMGIYRTTDGGSHWTAANQGLTNPDGTISSVVNSLWLDQNNPSVVLASTEFGGTFKSTDGGTTWKNVDRAESTRFSQVGSDLYVASRKGVLRSTDDGSTWTVSLPLSKGATTVATAGGVTFAGSTSGDVYQLSGSSWTKLGHPGTGPIHDLTVDPFDTKVIYASVDDRNTWNECPHASVDGGTKWTAINCNLFSIGSQAIAFSNVTPHRLFVGDDGSGSILYFKGDGNPNPAISYGAYGIIDVRYVIPVKGKSKSDDACYILLDQGLAYAPTCSSGGVSYLSAQVNSTLAYDVAVSPDDKNVEAPLQDLGSTSSQNGGKTWPVTGPAGEGGEARYHPDNSGYCYIAHPDEGLFISTDGCATFSSDANILPESLTFDPSNANTLYVVDISVNQVSKSADKGFTWKAAGWKFTNPYQVAQAPSDANCFLVATGTSTSPSALFYSHDGGKTWKQSSGLPKNQRVFPEQIYFPTHRFYAAFDPKDASKVLLADHDPKTDNVLMFRSIDGGQNFTHVHTFVQPQPPRPWPQILLPREERNSHKGEFYYATRFYANRVVFNPNAKSSDPAVIVTTRFGAFASMDIGTTWKRIDTTSIAHHFEGATWDGNGHVYLASYGEGVIRSGTPIQP
jgi:photosystem II stability/assembly factor-like uncharacterized protein